MLISEEKLPLIAFLIATWALAVSAFFVGRWTSDPVVEVIKHRTVKQACPEVEPVEVEAERDTDDERLTMAELAEAARWDDAIERCDTLEERWSPACENVELILGRALREELGSRLEAIDFMANRGLEFAPADFRRSRAPNISFSQEEVTEVTAWCALARQTQPEACRGLESMLAAGMFAAGDVATIPQAYAKMRQIGVVPLRELEHRYYPEARRAYEDGEFARAVRYCEHGVELGDERCIALLALSLDELGERKAACEVLAGIPSSELPFRCGRRAVSRQAVKRMKQAYVLGETGSK